MLPPAPFSGVLRPADRPLPGGADLSSIFPAGCLAPFLSPQPSQSLAPRDSHLGLGLPQCPAPAPTPSAHLPPGTRGPTPCWVGALWPVSSCLQPPGAPEPPRPLVPAAPWENLSCPRGQPLESCPVWALAPPQAQGGAPPPPSDLVSPSASPPAASPGPPPRAAATRTLLPPVTPRSVQLGFPPPSLPTPAPACPRGRRCLSSGGLQWGNQLPGCPRGVWN